ncbi:hypothetical protein V9P81_26460, partial [Enterobacter hormaechei subsp. hoffmannii]
KPPPQVVFSFSEQEITTVTTGSQEDHLLRETNYHYVCLSTYLGGSPSLATPRKILHSQPLNQQGQKS